jgi:hypothetical protein
MDIRHKTTTQTIDTAQESGFFAVADAYTLSDK